MDTSYITPPPKETNIRALTSSYNYEFEYNIEPITEQKKVNRKLSFSQNTEEPEPPITSN